MGNSSTSPQPAASVPDADQLHKVLLAMKHTSYEMQAKSEASKEEEDAEVKGVGGPHNRHVSRLVFVQPVGRHLNR